MTGPLRPEVGDDGPLTIRGGVGGIRFQWEELEEAARVLALLAADTGGVAVALGYLDRDVSELPWRIMHVEPVGGVAGPHYQAALAQLDGAWASALENGRALETTEERLRAGLRAYHLADGAAMAAMEAARRGTRGTATALARGAIDGGVLPVGPIGLLARSVGTAVPFDGTVEGVLDRMTAVEAEDPGTFEVLRAGTDRDPVYVVVLPGTQSGTVDGRSGSNPFDPGGIAEALAEDSRFTEEAVLDALGQAGAGDGDPLVVAGYSQGGLHAANLAGSDGLGGRYDVQLVLTVGSPTGWNPTEGSEYLHLEHLGDTVPQLDAAPNGDDRQRTTVTLGNRVPPLGRAADGYAEPWGFGPAHKLRNYSEGARLIDSSDAPSLAPAAGLLAIAGSTGVARRYSFTAVRRAHTAVRRPHTAVLRPHTAKVPKAAGGPPAQGGGSRLWP